MYIFTLCRVVMLPLFFLCLKPRIFNHDAFPVVFIFVFGVLGSISGSKLMMIGITKVDTHEKEVTGALMVSALVLGLSVGSSAAWIVPYVL
jgi:equilibrative nucleoside transporter 1/2/3